MKRTHFGYETENYFIFRFWGTNIFSCRKSVDGFGLYKKEGFSLCKGNPVGERISYSPWLSDIKEELKVLGEL